VLDGGSSVCGGSQPLPARDCKAVPFDASLSASCEAIHPPAWRAALDTWALPRAEIAGAEGYAALVDGRGFDAPPGGLLDAVLEAARAFRARHPSPASLTLLWPGPSPQLDWSLAGDAEAARMLVATLAAEWGARGLRVNALELPPGLGPEAWLPLLDFVAGPRAQFLTGQVIRPGAA